MQQFAFIYSNAPGWRASRHLTFWFSCFLLQLLIYSFSPSPALQNQSFSHRIIITLPETLIYLLPCFFLAYTLMNLVIPRYVVPGKYILAAVLSVLLVILTAALSALLSVTVIDSIRHWFADPIAPVIASEKHPPLYMQFGLAMLAGLRGSITVGGVAAAIKLIKCLSERQRAALLLEKEKANVELQMLKAQLHPHFLFNRAGLPHKVYIKIRGACDHPCVTTTWLPYLVPKTTPGLFAFGNSVAYSYNTFRLADVLADETFRHHFHSIRLPTGA